MVTWRNLWHQFWLAPGTRRARIFLSLWQVWLMLASGVGGVLWGWWGVGGGFIIAWTSHELLFRLWAERAAGVVEPDRHPYETVQQMGAHPHYVSTIERYWGPFGSDPDNTQSG